jgi:transposase-like protein
MHAYSEKFKKEVVKKVLTDGIIQIEISRKLNLSEYTVRKWKKKYADEVRNEIKQIDIESFFVEEDVDIEKLLAESEPDLIRHEKETVEKIIEKRKIPSEYTFSEKYSILSMIRKLSKDQLGLTLRTYGLQSQHIKLWEDEILFMGKKQINHDEYIKKLEQENKDLKKLLKNSEKKNYELGVLIELKKKYKSLFKEDGEE